MKASYLVVALFFSFTVALQSQTVDSIKIEQAGDFIKIRYKIMNSVPGQVYRVKALCSMDGGMNFEMRSVTGDVGDQVAGGKPEYWIVWDVLKDIDELKSVEFIVRAELVEDIQRSPIRKSVDWSKNRFHIWLSTEIPGPRPGLEIGFMGSWGFYSSIYYGGYGVERHWKNDSFVVEEIKKRKTPSAHLSISKRIIKKDIFQSHLTIGFSSSSYMLYNTTGGNVSYKPWYGFNFGIVTDIKRISISIGDSHFPQKLPDDYVLQVTARDYLSLGIGVRF